MGKRIEHRRRLQAFFSESPVKWYDWLILAALCLFCFVTFEMRDLYHTAGCSYGFLDGHFLDFYDYLAANAIGEDGTLGLHASYLPTVYIIFAIWNIPMKLFGIVPKATAQLGFTAIMWAKLLPCLVYLAGGYVVFRIAEELGMRDKKAKLCMYAYLTMPVSLFGQFILGQYESFIIFCVLMGFWAWLKKKTVPFIVWFGIAITFKYTALLLFIPLLVLREKRIFPIIGKCALVLVPFILESLLFFRSPTFSAYVFGFGTAGDDTLGFFTNAAYFTGIDAHSEKTYVYLAVLAFAGVTAYSYFKKVDSAGEKRYAPYICCLAAAALFCFSKWHAHWLMLAVPFWILTAFQHKNTKIFMFLDLIFMAVFCIFNVEAFYGAHDEILLSCGIFKFLMPDGKVNMTVKMSDYLGLLDENMCLSLLTALIAVYAIFKHPSFQADDADAPVKCMGWIRTRYIAGLLIFIIPAMLCVFQTLRLHAVYSEDRREKLLYVSDETVEQQFTAENGTLKRLAFPVGKTEEAEGTVTLSIENESGETLYETVFDIADMDDGEYVYADPGIALQDGVTYTAVFEVSETEKDSFCLCCCGSASDYADAEKNGKNMDMHLEMYVYE